MLVSLSATEELIIMRSEHVGQVAPESVSEEGAVGRWFRKAQKGPCSLMGASSWVWRRIVTC